LEAHAISRANAFGLLEELHRLEEEIIEIESVGIAQDSTVLRVDLSHLLIANVPGPLEGGLGILHTILRMTDLAQRHAWLQELVVVAEILQRLLDRGELIGGVVDDEVAIDADVRRLAPEQPRAQRMKRRDPDGPAVGPEEQLDPLAHFVGGLVRER